jgi:hypothetical protein
MLANMITKMKIGVIAGRELEWKFINKNWNCGGTKKKDK